MGKKSRCGDGVEVRGEKSPLFFFPEKLKTDCIDMNDRDDKPKRKQKLPKGKGAKCALAYSLIVDSMIEDGIPFDAADMMATTIVTNVLEATKQEEAEAKLRYDIYSTISNN
jgi:hypothetical protein